MEAPQLECFPQPNNFIMENSRRLDVLVGKRGFEPPFQSHRSDLCFWGLCYLIRQRTNALRLCSPPCIIPVQQFSRHTGQDC